MSTDTFYDLFYSFFTAFFPANLVTQYEDIFILLAMISVFVFIKTIINLIKSLFKVFKR